MQLNSFTHHSTFFFIQKQSENLQFLFFLLSFPSPHPPFKHHPKYSFIHYIYSISIYIQHNEKKSCNEFIFEDNEIRIKEEKKAAATSTKDDEKNRQWDVIKEGKGTRKKLKMLQEKKFIIKKYKFDISNFAFRLLCMNFFYCLYWKCWQ